MNDLDSKILVEFKLCIYPNIAPRVLNLTNRPTNEETLLATSMAGKNVRYQLRALHRALSDGS
jgi:hypothetical protein